MNVERVELSNFGSWASLDLEISRGVSLISGANGAGKSTILQAVSFALFGVSSGAERLIRRGTDHASVIVDVETEQGSLQVMRSILRSGTGAKIKLSVLRGQVGEWETLTAATNGETQAILDGLLGVSREVLEASAFSMQHSGASFCEAAPRDRKRILTDVLPSLAIWQPLADAAAAEKKAASETATIARGTLESLAGAGERKRDADARHAAALNERDNAEAEEQACDRRVAEYAAQAEAAREARRQHAAAVEAQQRAQADHARATAERATADDALDRAKTAAANAPSVDDARVADERAKSAVRVAETLHTAAVAEKRHHDEQLAEARRNVTSAEGAHASVKSTVTSLRTLLEDESSTGTCARCNQPLVSDEAKEIVQRTKVELGDAMVAETRAHEAAEVARARVAYLDANPAAPTDGADDALRTAREAAQAAQQRLTQAETTPALAGSIEAAQARARDASDREHETASALREATAVLEAEVFEPNALARMEGDYHAAQAAVLEARAAHGAAAAELARAEASANLAEQQATEETAARERLEAAELDAAIAGILAAGFGPTGVPAMIVDGVLGDLSDEANRVLAELSSPIRVELRSQRLLKSADRLADTLDIIALMDGHEAPWERLSGGEQTRLALALRAALTRLLASKSGARVRMLVVDEPAGLDADGSEHLAGVLNEFVAAGVFETILLVTHHDALADLIGNVVRIEKTPSGESRLVGAPAIATPERIAS